MQIKRAAGPPPRHIQSTPCPDVLRSSRNGIADSNLHADGSTRYLRGRRAVPNGSAAGAHCVIRGAPCAMA